MVSLATIQSLTLFFLPVLVPRLLSLYRTLRTSLSTRPQPRPLPQLTSRALNILFASSLVTFLYTLPIPGKWATSPSNIFALTNSRLHIPTDVLFTRLALLRPSGHLTHFDNALRSKLTTPAARSIYLRFGPSTLLDCPGFCTPDNPRSYLLYHLPTNVLLPHLVHLLILGLATSGPLTGGDAARWRNKFTLAGLGLAVLDIYITSSYTPTINANMPSPPGLYWTASTLRPLILCIVDAAAAFLIYASATNRLPFLNPELPLEEVLEQRREQMLVQASLALQTANSKLHAVAVTRNAVVRDEKLKGRDDDYWRAVVTMEGSGRDEPGVRGLGEGSVWEEEEVQEAVARAMGAKEVDVGRLGVEARNYVEGITKGLESEDQGTNG